jgi:hypothetical protein
MIGIAISSPIRAQGIAPGSVWVNSGGSEMTIAVDTNGLMSGTYVNKVDGFSWKNEPMALSGWVNGDLVIVFLLSRKIPTSIAIH